MRKKTTDRDNCAFSDKIYALSTTGCVCGHGDRPRKIDIKFHGENDDPMIPYFFQAKPYRMKHLLWGPEEIPHTIHSGQFLCGLVSTLQEHLTELEGGHARSHTVWSSK